jgi:ribonuclease J
MPVHGDHRRLRMHGQLADAVGVEPERVFMTSNGSPVEIDRAGARIAESQQSGVIFVDGVDVGSLEDVALRDRRMLSADGIFIVVATVSGDDGRSVSPPEVIFRGVPFLDSVDGLVDEVREAVDDSLSRSAEEEIREISLLQDHLHDDVARFVYERLKRRPMILPVVVEV